MKIINIMKKVFKNLFQELFMKTKNKNFLNINIY